MVNKHFVFLVRLGLVAVRITYDTSLERIPKGEVEARTILQRRGGYKMTFYKVSLHLAGVVGT